jgi:hypothetical protein
VEPRAPLAYKEQQVRVLTELQALKAQQAPQAQLVQLVFRALRVPQVLMALPGPRAPLAWRDLMVQQV